jgi:hypothetical protein
MKAIRIANVHLTTASCSESVSRYIPISTRTRTMHTSPTAIVYKKHYLLLVLAIPHWQYIRPVIVYITVMEQSRMSAVRLNLWSATPKH